MSELIDSKIRNIENTFLPNCKTELLSIDDIISLLKKGMCSLTILPEKVKENVVIVIGQRTTKD